MPNTEIGLDTLDMPAPMTFDEIIDGVRADEISLATAVAETATRNSDERTARWLAGETV